MCNKKFLTPFACPVGAVSPIFALSFQLTAYGAFVDLQNLHYLALLYPVIQ